VLSFWEKSSLLKGDIAIIGGGLVGMSVASSLKEKFPGKSITVFERSSLPYGASTRNAGFACFGSLTEVMSDIQLMGQEAARELLFQRWMGLQITRKRLGDKALGFIPAGGYELIENGSDISGSIATINQMVEDFIPNYISRSDDVKSRLGIMAPGQIFSMSEEGQVDTGALMKSMEQYALQLGVVIRTGTEITRLEVNKLIVNDRFRGEMEFQAEKIVVCNNAFASSLMPQLELYPGRGQVFITKAIPNLAFSGNLHIEEGFYYLRNVNNRLLFGGGRNLDIQTEETTDFALNNSIQRALVDKLDNLFGTGFKYEIDLRWTGIMAFGKDKTPIVERVDDHLYVAVKMGGMGIALAGFIGEEIAEMMDC
jgi:glycine/D-amino acid oxidase-like deaminating enzyme